MPLYNYKAANSEGQIVYNRKAEAISRYALMKKLKENGLLPITVTQIKISTKANKIMKKQKRNIESSNSVLKTVREQEIARNINSKGNSFFEKAKKALFSNVNITNRDIIIFTQNFYLLKKANFNNIHALSTIIETTENDSFRAIIEDILLGVEAGENMYTTMEYYTGVFPPIYINMIKVGELSRLINKSFRASSKIFRR